MEQSISDRVRGIGGSPRSKGRWKWVGSGSSQAMGNMRGGSSRGN